MDLIRMRRLCELLELSRPTIYKYIKGGLPVHYVGTIPYFDIKEIEKWLKSQKEE